MNLEEIRNIKEDDFFLEIFKNPKISEKNVVTIHRRLVKLTDSYTECKTCYRYFHKQEDRQHPNVCSLIVEKIFLEVDLRSQKIQLENQDMQINSKDMEILALKNALKTRESFAEQADELFLLRSHRFQEESERPDPPTKKIKREAI